jgi:CHAD domain-containing protein
MPYAFVSGEPLSAAIPRLMLEQLDRAAGFLAEADVHNARKRIKEIRAVLRLVRSALGAQFAVENRWYRDAARALASARDAEAVLEALAKLPLDARVKRRARRVLSRGTAAVAVAPVSLDEARVLLASWPELPDDFATIGAGLIRTYRDGRRDLALVRAEGSAHNLHEWRKRVKDLWYHTQLLRPVWPEVLKAHAAALNTLSDHLGDHHDLHVLDALAVEHDLPEVRAAIATRLPELERAALDLGARIYAEKPRAYQARIAAYWQTWQV